MRSAVLRDFGEPFEIEEIPKPEPGPGQVLVRIAGAGVCHSDLHGRAGGPFAPPLRMGHENGGYVEEFGPGVDSIDGIAIGDPVVVFGGWGCGRCRFCMGGQEQLCDPRRWGGMGAPGGYAEYLLVPALRHLLPARGLDPVVAAPLTDAALTPYSAVKKVLTKLTPGTTTLVIGAGGLGQYAIQFLKLLTQSTVIVADTAADKRAIAMGLGADLAVDPREDAAAEHVREVAGGEGVAAGIDFVGVDATLRFGAAVLARQGTLVLLGLAGGSVPFSYLGTAMEARMTTSNRGSRNDLDDVLALAPAGKLVHRVERHPLEDINDVFERLASGKVGGRAVLTP